MYIQYINTVSGGQKETDWRRQLSSTMWIAGIEPNSSGFGSKHPYPLIHLIVSVNFT